MSEPAPLELYRHVVQPDWIDYNGHMNVAYYVLAFDQATDALADYLGIDAGYRARTHCSIFVLESHITYDRELVGGDPLRCTTQLLDHDTKRIHYFHRMYHAEQGYLAATTELILLHVDLSQRRSAVFPDDTLSALTALAEQHRQLPRPDQAGRVIGIRRSGSS